MKDPHRFFPFESSRCCEYNEEREDGYIFVDRNQLFFMCITASDVQPDLSTDLCDPLFSHDGAGQGIYGILVYQESPTKFFDSNAVF